MSSWTRRAERAAVVALSIALSLATLEAALRGLDGLPLFALQIPIAVPRLGRADARRAADLRYLASIPLAPGVDRAWYALNPAPRTSPPAASPETAARIERYKLVDPLGAFFVWNRVYLLREMCAGSAFGSLGVLDDFYVFDAPDGGAYPIYRHLPYIDAPQWFLPNRFGWRGPDITVAKPAGTIRIAFLGASTTVGPYYLPHAPTEILEHWLNLWLAARGPYRVEVLNTARTGVDVHTTAAVVEQELLPLEPDLSVYYEGANSFRPGLLLHLPRGFTPAAPHPNITFKWPVERYSVLARRVRSVVDVWLTDEGREPAKQTFEIRWPAEVDEFDPDVTRPLPMDMQIEVAQFDRMRRALTAQGGRFAMASFVWMVEDGIRLELPRDLILFNYLNSTYYPLTYGQLRRAVDFQNRVFRNFARHHGLPFFDVERSAPRDPLLFSDAIHMTEQGMRLQAWTFLQHLVPWLDAEISAGRLPRPAVAPQSGHPAIKAGTPPLLSRAAILAGCEK